MHYFCAMNVPTIDFLGLHITEPFTWLTNWLVAAFALRYGYFLYFDKFADITQKFWSVFFVFIGLASITGGTAHGFINYVGQNFHYAAWILTGLAIFAAQLGTLQLIEHEKMRSATRIFSYIQLLILVSSVMYLHNFDSVRINSAVGLVGIVIPFSLIHYVKHRDRRSALIILGILSNLIPGIIHAFRISYNYWFNFNDISHVVMIFCFYIMYKGAKQNINIELSRKLTKAAA
jgi:uncharacterized protein DUF6962